MSVHVHLPTSRQPQNHWAKPTVEQLFGYATEQIMLAASEPWPGERIRLAEHVPSVTGFVRRVEVSGRTLYAKYSYLGNSLVSVLRGSCGDWDQVLAAQLAYVAAPGSLLEREAAQLCLLHRLGRPRAHRVAAFRCGALFTETGPGVSLAQLLCAEPRRVGELLGRTWVELRELHRPEMARRFARSVAIKERGIAGIFARKFTGIGANVYLDQLVAEWPDHPGERDELRAVLRRVVTRLGRLWAVTPETAGPVLVYGDLKPEHVVFEHHAVASDRPVFIDPGMSCARATVDAAKLVSRTI
ncbi:MAG: phosphotransferase, partial [Pseudonocardiaceae bacterium]